jgi:hypothetical protein
MKTMLGSSPRLLLLWAALGCCLGIAQGQSADQNKPKETPPAKAEAKTSPVLKPQPTTTNEINLNGYTWKISDLQPLKASGTKSGQPSQHPATQTHAQSASKPLESDANQPPSH